MDALLHRVAEAIALGLEAAAVITIAMGAVEAALRIGAAVLTRPTTHGQKKEAWRRFGTWLLLGLEFELAADIVRSVITPSWLEIGQLGAIAAIRTFLNFFLEQDLEHSSAAEAHRTAPDEPSGATPVAVATRTASPGSHR